MHCCTRHELTLAQMEQLRLDSVFRPAALPMLTDTAACSTKSVSQFIKPIHQEPLSWDWLVTRQVGQQRGNAFFVTQANVGRRKKRRILYNFR